MIRKLSEIIRPVEDGALGKRIGEAKARTLRRNQAHTGDSGAVVEHRRGQARRGNAVVEEERFSKRVAVLRPAQCSTIR